MIYTHNLDPAIFKLGQLQPRWYAVMYILGFIFAYLIISRHPKFKALGKTKDDAMDLLTYGFVGVLAGGRLGYVLFYNLQQYLANPLEILKIWSGGMSFHGGLIGSILAIAFYARKKKIPILTMFDIAALPTPIGLFFGRLGNFINGELWGKPTDGSWGVRFKDVYKDPQGNPLVDAQGNFAPQHGVPRHPTQLYEAALEGLLLFFILWLATHFGKKLKPGSVGALFLLGYGCARFAVEFNRLPDSQLGYLYGGWLTMGHLLSAPMILGGLIMLLVVNRPGAKAFEPLEVNTAKAFADPNKPAVSVHFKTQPLPEVELPEDQVSEASEKPEKEA